LEDLRITAAQIKIDDSTCRIVEHQSRLCHLRRARNRNGDIRQRTGNQPFRVSERNIRKSAAFGGRPLSKLIISAKMAGRER
jgi:hypothetical protein